MPLGDKVRTARKNSGWTTQKLATKVGLSQSYISGIEHNKKSPSAKTILKLADAFHTSFDFLLRDDLKSKIDSARYLPYREIIDQAIAAGISPAELLIAVLFIARCK